MIKNFINNIKKNFEIFALVSLIIVAAFSTSYFNFKKNEATETYLNIVDNIYLKKTLSHIINNLEPKYKKIKHKIKSGETFDKILQNYSVDKQEVNKIKNSLQTKINLNKLNTKQIIQFSLDKTNNKITEFYFHISNTQKIYLKRNIENDSFNKEILSIKLNKKIIYKENIILQSLYKSATDENIPANIIIEYAEFTVSIDFQRDVRKKISFK